MLREARRALDQALVDARHWTTFTVRILLSTMVLAAGLLSGALIEAERRAEMRLEIQATSNSLARLHARDGLEMLALEIRQRQTEDTLLFFGLRDGNGRILADETLHSPQRLGWSEYMQRGHTRIALLRQLSDRTTLSVAADLTAETADGVLVSRIIAGIGALGVLATICLTLLEGQTIRAELGAITAGMSRVAKGDFTQRLHESGRSDQFSKASVEINRVLATLERRDGEMKSALQSLAHEMRTPLSHVVQQLEILRDDDAPREEKAAALQAASGKLDHVLRGYDSILRLAHIESEPIDRDAPVIDLALLVGNVAEAYAASFLDEGRTIALDTSAAPISGDQTLIDIVTSTLLENVLRHTPAPTGAALSTGVISGRSFLSVADNGPGVPESERTVITQRFHRGASSQGLGLGLTIVESIARRLDGKLALSDANPGLRVTLWFPVAENDASRDMRATKAA